MARAASQAPDGGQAHQSLDRLVADPDALPENQLSLDTTRADPQVTRNVRHLPPPSEQVDDPQPELCRIAAPARSTPASDAIRVFEPQRSSPQSRLL